MSTNKIDGKTAKRYAKALFDLTEHDQLDSVIDGLKEITEIWSNSAELREALTNPTYKTDEQISVAGDVAKLAKDSVSFVNFVKLLTENKRIGGIAEITDAFSTLVAELREILSLTITSAKEVSEGDKTALLEKVKGEFGSLATIYWEIDPGLIGGMIVRAGDKQLDGSVRGNLEKIRTELLN